MMGREKGCTATGGKGCWVLCAVGSGVTSRGNMHEVISCHPFTPWCYGHGVVAGMVVAG